jgi:hypothetical protein
MSDTKSYEASTNIAVKVSKGAESACWKIDAKRRLQNF